MSRFYLLALLASAAQSTSASTPNEWSRLEWRAKQTCFAASGFRQPTASNAAVFDDRVGIVAMLISGTYRQAHMKGARGKSLCLYNRRLGTAVIQEVVGWSDAEPADEPWQ